MKMEVSGQRRDTEGHVGDNVVPSAQDVLNLKCPWTIHRVVCYPDNVGADTTGNSSATQNIRKTINKQGSIWQVYEWDFLKRRKWKKKPWETQHSSRESRVKAFSKRS